MRCRDNHTIKLLQYQTLYYKCFTTFERILRKYNTTVNLLAQICVCKRLLNRKRNCSYKKKLIYASTNCSSCEVKTLARPINCRLLNSLSASIFKALQSCHELVKMFSQCQTGWIRVGHPVTRRLTRIQAVCI